MRRWGYLIFAFLFDTACAVLLDKNSYILYIYL